MLVLEQLQPLCVSEEKFCTTFFHFPRAEETRGVREGGREGGREGREGRREGGEGGRGGEGREGGREGREGGRGGEGREGGREGGKGGCMCKVGNDCDKIIFHVIVKYCLIKISLYYSIFIFSL